MLFSDGILYFARLIERRTPNADLGPLYLSLFEDALAKSGGVTRREIQALGRMLVRENLDLLLAHTPDVLTPIGLLLRDPKGNLEDRKRPICCNSLFGETFGISLVDARQKRLGDSSSFVLLLCSDMQEHEKFKLFKPLGQTLVKHVLQVEANVNELLSDAWMIVKSNKAGPLSKPQAVEEPAPVTQPSSKSAETPSKPWPTKADQMGLFEELEPKTEPKKRPKVDPPCSEKTNPFTDDEMEQILRGVEEDPKKSAETLQDVDINDPISVSPVVNIKHPDQPRAANIIAETFDNYRHVLKNDPAFVGMHYHPRHGLLLVMIAVDGINDLMQTVYRGGAIFDPRKNKMVTHKYLTSVVGPFYWTDDRGAKYVVKAIPWRRGLCGKYWTNVARGTGHDDVEDMKRWFLLTLDEETKQPKLRFWSGEKGERNFNVYLNRLRQETLKRRRNIQEPVYQ